MGVNDATRRFGWLLLTASVLPVFVHDVLRIVARDFTTGYFVGYSVGLLVGYVGLAYYRGEFTNGGESGGA